ncbi:MAG: hypothetical protein JXA54_04915 [Candidatus Heimdallarchaeota archaeon]|nr:hypothetical protein [Candidatus Heimdallarchaeota archaeon]
MSNEGNRTQDNSINDTIYLSKILLFTKDAQIFADKMKDLSESTVSTNCLNTIGMYPLISRVDTQLGRLCMSIWIISSAERFSQFRMAYYSGSSHSIILVKETESYENLSYLYQMSPRGVPVTILTISSSSKNYQNNRLEIDDEEENRLISYKTINSISDLNNIFDEIGIKISNDILSGEYRIFSPQLIKPSNVFKLYNIKSFEKVQDIISRLGYHLDDNGIVVINKNDFTFEIDFYRNQVKANVTNCLSCNQKCKHYRKLCVVEEEQGYSNQIHFDNLRALAILYSIYEGNFETLTGEKPKEDIKYQLHRLRSLYEVNCPEYKDELDFQKKQQKLLNKKKICS